MISNQILPNTLEGMKAITTVDLCVMDTDGKILASTCAKAEECSGAARTFAKSTTDSKQEKDYLFLKIYDEYQLEYILVAFGNGGEVSTVGKMAAFQLQGLLAAYKERFDKDNFFKNLLLDNLLLVDIYNRAKKLHIDTEVKRVIFIVEMPEDKDVNTLEHVRAILSSKCKIFVTAVDEKSAILVREVDIEHSLKHSTGEDSTKQEGLKYDNGKPLVGDALQIFGKAIMAVGECVLEGQKKYPTIDNWKKVDNAQQRYTNALIRHLIKHLSGQEMDEDSGLKHIQHVAWNALAICQLYLEEKGK